MPVLPGTTGLQRLVRPSRPSLRAGRTFLGVAVLELEGMQVSRKGKILTAVAVMVALAVAFVCVEVDIATKSIQFDLRKIGESVYEAHSKSGKWPAQIADLEGTEYLKMPQRRTMLDEGVFVVVWQGDLDPNPAVNANRVLAYDNSSLLSRFGSVWVCRGDLRIERMSAKDMQALKIRVQ